MIKIGKTKGYTLAEVLIAFAVVGVLAAVLLPGIQRSHQNKDKALYLKTSMRLTNIVDTLLNDEVAYPNKDKKGDGNGVGDEPQYIYSDSLFYNTFMYNSLATKFGLSSSSYNSKLCRLIAEKGYRVDGDKCNNDNADIPDYSSSLEPAFSTPDGVDFYVYTQKKDINDGDTLDNKGRYVKSYKTIVYIDTNGKDKGNNCMFNRSSCINPDIFEFMILADGQIFPMDPMGIYYTHNSRDMKKKEYNEQRDKDELDKIANLLTDEDKKKKMSDKKAVAYIRPIVNKNYNPDPEEIGTPTSTDYEDQTFNLGE